MLAPLIACACPLAFSQTNDSQSAAGASDGYSYITSVKAYETEARSIESIDVAHEVFRILATKKMGIEDFGSPHHAKAVAYLKVLEQRADKGDVDASLWDGVYQLSICEGMKENKHVELAVKICGNAMDRLHHAAESKNPNAMEEIADAYMEGIAVRPSKFIAADNYINAAETFNQLGNREGSLRAIENALSAVPDHPKALKLKFELLQ